MLAVARLSLIVIIMLDLRLHFNNLFTPFQDFIINTRWSYYNVNTRLVDLVKLFWLKLNVLIDIVLGFENLFCANSVAWYI